MTCLGLHLRKRISALRFGSHGASLFLVDWNMQGATEPANETVVLLYPGYQTFLKQPFVGGAVQSGRLFNKETSGNALGCGSDPAETE